MMSRKILLLLTVMLSMLLMTSCISSIQLNERALVQAIGLDRNEDGSISLTMQVFSPGSSERGSLDATATNATIIEGTGVTLSQAVQKATATQGKELFLGHSRAIIIGSALAKSGLAETLKYFSANVESRQNMNLVIADSRASDILKAKINQGILPAQTLEKILENAHNNGICKNIKLYEFLQFMEQKNSVAIPMLTLEKEIKKTDSSGSDEKEKASESNEIEPVSNIKASGMAIFTNYQMVSFLDEEESRGFLWIDNGVKNAILVLETDKYQMAEIKVYHSKSHVTLNPDNDDISFKIDINCKAIIGEILIKNGKSFDVADINSLSSSGEDIIKSECSKALNKALIQSKADIFSFDDLVWARDVKLWKTVRNDWEDKLKDLKIDINVKINIDRIGV